MTTSDSCIIFTLVLVSVYYIKPRFLFQDNGKLSEFGVGYTKNNEKRTLFHMIILVFILALLIVFIGKVRITHH